MADAPQSTEGGATGTQGNPLEVLLAFLKLGVSAFGGPIAHLGYFRNEFVRRRAWLDEATYADLVALCQFLPGPASSQTGFAIGLMRAGPLGALAAWTGFTLPSAILMTVIAMGAAAMRGPIAQGALHGLKLVAVAVVAQAVFGMARTLTPDARRAAIALVAVGLVTTLPAAFATLAAITLGALAGLMLCRAPANAAPAQTRSFHVSRPAGIVALALYLVLLVGGPAVAALAHSDVVARFDAFYRSGALVFGGGHVVLPLLKQALVDPGWIGQDAFLAGYGAAQAMPGPLFTFGAYLGAAMPTAPNGIAGAAFGLVALFLPGLLILIAALPFWSMLRDLLAAQAAMRGANAAVVGILGAALYNPLWTSSVLTPADFTTALAGFVLLVAFRAPPIAVVALGLLVGVGRGLV
jgi:chromate transporter